MSAPFELITFEPLPMCSVCGSTVSRLAGQYTVNALVLSHTCCDACGPVQMNPRTTEASIKAFYQSAYWQHVVDTNGPSGVAASQKKAAPARTQDPRHARQRAGRLYLARRRGIRSSSAVGGGASHAAFFGLEISRQAPKVR